MDYSQGYAARFRLFAVDRKTWQDAWELPALKGASIERDIDDELIESCSIVTSEEVPCGYVRIYMEAVGGDAAREAIATMLVTTPDRESGAASDSCEADGYSVLKAASGRQLEPSWHLPKGSDPVAAASRLLADACAAPVEGATSDIITDHTVACEDGDTALSMARHLLEATGYGISIDWMGRIKVGESMTEPVAVLDDETASIVMDGDIDDKTDIFDAPNVFMAKKGQKCAIARNEDDSSPLSVQNAGWENWESEEVKTLNGETLQGYANRRLQELSTVKRQIEYEREWDPRIAVGCLTDDRFDSRGIRGIFKVEAQKVEIGKGVTVSELASSATEAWRA